MGELRTASRRTPDSARKLIHTGVMDFYVPIHSNIALGYSGSGVKWYDVTSGINADNNILMGSRVGSIDTRGTNGASSS